MLFGKSYFCLQYLLCAVISVHSGPPWPFLTFAVFSLLLFVTIVRNNTLLKQIMFRSVWFCSSAKFSLYSSRIPCLVIFFKIINYRVLTNFNDALYYQRDYQIQTSWKGVELWCMWEIRCKIIWSLWEYLLKGLNISLIFIFVSHLVKTRIVLGMRNKEKGSGVLCLVLYLTFSW